MGAVFKAGVLFICFAAAVATASALPPTCRVVAIPELDGSLDHLVLKPGLAEKINLIRKELGWLLASDPQARRTFLELKDSNHPLWLRIFENLSANGEVNVGQWIRHFPQLRIELGFEGFPEEREFLSGNATAALYFKKDGADILVYGRTLTGNEEAAKKLLREHMENVASNLRVVSFALEPRKYPTFAPEQQIWVARLARVLVN